jgi:hypothetical protein
MSLVSMLPLISSRWTPFRASLSQCLLFNARRKWRNPDILQTVRVSNFRPATVESVHAYRVLNRRLSQFAVACYLYLYKMRSQRADRKMILAVLLVEPMHGRFRDAQYPFKSLRRAVRVLAIDTLCFPSQLLRSHQHIATNGFAV